MRPRAAGWPFAGPSPARPGADPILAKLASLVALTTGDCAAIEGLCWNVRRVDAHRAIVAQGDRSGGLQIMVEGWACRFRRLRNGDRQMSQLLLPGDVVDDPASVSDPVEQGLAAISPVLIASVAPHALAAALASHPALARAFARSASVDLGVARAWLVGLGGRNAIERVAHLLCELHDRSRRIGRADAQGFALPLTQLELAEATAQTAVHVNRTVRKLRERGLATIGGGRATLLDRAGLEELADYDPGYLRLSTSP